MQVYYILRYYSVTVTFHDFTMIVLILLGTYTSRHEALGVIVLLLRLREGQIRQQTKFASVRSLISDDLKHIRRQGHLVHGDFVNVTIQYFSLG